MHGDADGGEQERLVVVVEMIRFWVTRFAVWWKRVVFSFVIGDSLFSVVETNGALTVDVATLDGHESDKDMDGAEEEFGGHPVSR